MTPQARVQAAIELLDAIIDAARGGGAAADTLISRYFSTRRYAGSKDRRAVRELVYAAIRRAGDSPATGRAAMLGLAQDREDLATAFDGSPHGPAPLSDADHASPAALIPRWIMPHLVSHVRDNAGEHSALLERAPLDLRINRLHPDADAARSAFPEAQVVPHLPDALRLPEGSVVEATEAYKTGLVEVQDAGSQMIVAACSAWPGMTVLDLCAGAGGKTLALAAAMAGHGRLIAADTSRPRLDRLPERARRAGADVEILLLDGGRERDRLMDLDGLCDVVLVDAPCSGTGTWRRNPEGRWRISPDRIDALAREQARILDLAAPLVRPAGRLVYAVCALSEQEGAAQVDAFLARHAGWTPLPLPFGRECGAGRLLTPAHDGTDGFFLAALEKQ